MNAPPPIARPEPATEPPASRSPHTTLIILNLAGAPYLPACLEALRLQTDDRFEVVLVDQGNADDSTREAVQRFGPHFGARLKVFWSGKNLGFTGGNNLVIPSITTPWLGLLNQDAEVAPGWMAALHRAAEQPVAPGEAPIGMVASHILLRDPPGLLDNTGHLLYPDGLNFPRGRGEPDPLAPASTPAHAPTHETEVLCPSGCAGLYRTDAVQRLGGLEPRFFAYGDDLELGLSLRALGYRCVYASDARVTHQLSGSWGRQSLRKAFLVERNRLWVTFKHFPPAQLLQVPFWTLSRYAATALTGLQGEGPAAGLGKEGPPILATLGALGLAHLDALRGLPAMLKARRRLQEVSQAQPVVPRAASSQTRAGVVPQALTYFRARLNQLAHQRLTRG